MFDQAYFPAPDTTGTITLTKADPTPMTGQFIGEIDNLHMVQVDQDASGNQIDPGTGCTADFPKISFNWTIQTAPPMASGRSAGSIVRVGIPFDLATGTTGKVYVQNWDQGTQEY
jgi:hypothetical protein